MKPETARIGFSDLRQFLESLEKSGQLLRVSDEVDVKHEIAAYIRKTSDTNGPALLFENVKGHSMQVVGGVFATRALMLHALQMSEETVIRDFTAALGRCEPTKLVASGPCQEVVHLGEDADLTALPNPTYCEDDSGPYISAAVAITKDPEDGGKNASIYRAEIQGKRALGILAEAPHHLGIHYEKAEALGKPLDVALAIGVEPSAQIATQWEAAYGVDELSFAAALQGRPLEVVKCKTVDLEVPATTEIVVEGRMHPGVREQEGPFGEYTGYYTATYPKPVIEVTAITHRKQPLYQAMLTGVPTTENHVLKMIPMESSCYAMLSKRFPSVKAVHFHGAGGVGLILIVAIQQRVKYEARALISQLVGSHGSKVIIVVDDDIDIFDMEAVMWAVSTRSQPEHDAMVFPHMMGWQLDPSAPERGVTSMLGIDATRPFGKPFDKTTEVPGVDKVPDLQELLARSR